MFNVHSRIAARRMRSAISGLLAMHPFFGNLALRVPLVESAKHETMASDGVSLFYNPNWISQQTSETLKAGVARLVLACSLKHHTRRGDRNYARWQVASKFATDPILAESGLQPIDYSGSTEFSGKSCEQIYDLLPEQEDEQSCSGQQPASHDPDGKGEICDMPAGADETVQENEQGWDQASHQACSLAKAAGRESADMTKLVRSRHENTVDWRSLLEELMTEFSPRDYTWARPNRRFIGDDLYLPSLDGRELGQICVVIDSSGSVDEKSLKMFWGEIREISGHCSETVRIIQCDYRVTSDEVHSSCDLPFEIEVLGGGGTNFRPPFQLIADGDRTPAALIYFTDLRCEHWPSDPGYPVIWADFAGDRSQVPFGEIVKIGN